VRWQFNLALERAGIDQPAFTALATGTGLGGVARRLSPGGWGVALGGAACGLAAALGVWLWAHYRGRGRGWRVSALLAAVLAVALGAAAGVSLRTYGLLAEWNIAVVAQNTLLRLGADGGDERAEDRASAGRFAGGGGQGIFGLEPFGVPQRPDRVGVRSDAVVPVYRRGNGPAVGRGSGRAGYS